MSSFIKFDRPLLIRDGKGTVVYEHAAFARCVEDVKATAAIGRGEAVILTQASTVLPRWDYSVIGVDVNFAGAQVSGGTTNSPCVLAGERVATATSKCYLGVAMENIATGITGHVCVDGISAAKCVNPPTNNVLGNPVIGHATPGLVDAVTTNPTAVGICLGSVYVIAGTGAGSMGSVNQLGVLINPR